MNTSKKSSGNKAPVIAYRVDYAKGEFQGFGFAGVHGKAANFRADDGVGNPVTGPALRPEGHARRTCRRRCLLHPRRLVAVRQANFGTQADAPSPPATTGDLRDARVVGPVGHGGLQVGSAPPEPPRAPTSVSNKKNGGGLLGYSFDIRRRPRTPRRIGDFAIGRGDPERSRRSPV